MRRPILDPFEPAESPEPAEPGRAPSEPEFGRLAARIRGVIQRWAWRVTGDEDDAEDVAQLVLLRVRARLGDFRGRSRFTSWLYRITMNVALDRRRVEQRRSVLLMNGRQDLVESAATETLASAGDTERLVELIRLHHTQLPARQREVFEMADLRGISTMAIAVQLGISPVTARVLLHKARRKIRLLMLEHHATLLEDYHT